MTRSSKLLGGLAGLAMVYLRYNGPKAAEAEFAPSEWPLPDRGQGAPGSVPVGAPVSLP